MNDAFRFRCQSVAAVPASGSLRISRTMPALLGGLLLAVAASLPLSAAAHHNGEDHDEDAHHHHDEAQEAADGVVVKGGYTFAPRPGVPNIGVYFDQVSNGSGKADQLVSAQAPFGKRTELHEMKMDGQVMHMREVPGIELPAHGSVDMQKGASYHVMVMGLDKPLKAGERFELKLRFRDAGEQTVEVEVRDAAKAGSKHHHHHHGSGEHKH